MSKYIRKTDREVVTVVTMGNYLAGLAQKHKVNNVESLFLTQIKAVGLPMPTEQFKWHPERKFRADFAYEPIKLLIEIDGGVWQLGGHSSGTGINRDREKDCEALILGWKVLRVTSDMVKSGSAINYLEKIFKGNK